MNMDNEQQEAEKFWDRINLGTQVIGTVKGITFVRDLSDYDDSPWFNQSGYIDVFATAEDAAFINEAVHREVRLKP